MMRNIDMVSLESEFSVHKWILVRFLGIQFQESSSETYLFPKFQSPLRVHLMPLF